MLRVQKTIYVAMSGGVDSSVAAALLKNLPVLPTGQAGGRQDGKFNVIGVFMKPWQPSIHESQNTNQKFKNVAGNMLHDTCLWKQDREDALRAATVLNVPLLTWDFSKEYKKCVTDYMLREYKAGRTPNPDVMCNKEIKFGLFFKKAMKEGSDYIATGHYARIAQVQKLKVHKDSNIIKNKDPKELDKLDELYKLFTARDSAKDQTYFLWTLTQKHLAKTLFPIGDYLKPEVRKMAKKFGLPNHDKKDSQGVCFIGPLNMKNFLKNYIKPKSGKILDLNGKELGKHDGVYYYTIGQRHGLNLGLGGGPYFVVAKDIKKNIIYAGTEKDLISAKTKVKNINWIVVEPKFPAELLVRTRYRAPLKKAVLYKNGKLIFKQPERAITSGQSAVFYHGKEMLGGGIIE